MDDSISDVGVLIDVERTQLGDFRVYFGVLLDPLDRLKYGLFTVVGRKIAVQEPIIGKYWVIVIHVQYVDFENCFRRGTDYI